MPRPDTEPTASMPSSATRKQPKPPKPLKPRKSSEHVAQKRAQRLSEIIVAATRLFNRAGFLATTMDEIAQAVGMNPATLYHYVRNKEELAYQAYLRSCERRRSQLEYANDRKLDGLSRIRRFFDALRGQEHRPALLSEVGALHQEWADHVRRTQRGNIQTVQAMVARGVRDGSITARDPALTGIGVLSVVEWMAFWYTARLPYSLDEAVTVIEDVLLNGITHPSEQPRRVPAVTPAFPPQPAPNPFDRTAMAEAKLQQFLRVAMDSFNKVGVHATSIDQCAAELNLTKGAFYYYFRNKEELLYLCYKRALELNWQAAVHLEPRDPIEREILWRRSLFERHVSEYGPFPTYHHVTFLKPAHRKTVLDELMKQQRTDGDIVEQAMASGHYRRLDPFLVEKVRAGLTNWFPTWYSTKGRATPTEVADNHSELFLFGLKPRTQPTRRGRQVR